VKKRQAAEEIVRLVREAEALLAQGKPVEEACRQLGISESTLVRWRHRYGGLSTPEAKRLRELERENGELKHIVADLELAKRFLQEAVKRLGKA
jgi:putative transposase